MDNRGRRIGQGELGEEKNPNPSCGGSRRNSSGEKKEEENGKGNGVVRRIREVGGEGGIVVTDGAGSIGSC